MGAYQTSPRPSLSIERSGANVIIHWPVAGTSNRVLQKSSDLTSPESWVPATGTVANDGTNNSVMIPATNHHEFFRLR